MVGVRRGIFFQTFPFQDKYIFLNYFFFRIHPAQMHVDIGLVEPSVFIEPFSVADGNFCTCFAAYFKFNHSGNVFSHRIHKSVRIDLTHAGGFKGPGNTDFRHALRQDHGGRRSHNFYRLPFCVIKLQLIPSYLFQSSIIG